MSILVLTSDTLIGTPATGNIEYNGQFYGTDSNASRAQMQRIVQETAQATTSGTSKDFTGIPAWVKRITVMFSGVSTNGTSLQIIRLGTSGGIETTGYVGTATTNGSTVSSTVGVLVGYRGDAANVYSGAIVFTLLNASSNLWVAQGVNSGAGGSTGDCSSVGATKTLSGTLDRVRITTVNGTDTFDAGSINILYEG
jgi:hypothetical protein